MTWDPTEHPRDPRTGEFVETADTQGWLGHVAGALAQTPQAKQGAVEAFAEQVRQNFPGTKINVARSTITGVITLSSIVVPERSRGSGTRIMTALIELADRQGDVIALTPSADFGGSKSRLIKFYKRFGFVENKGRNKDYEISDTMYRLPGRSS